MHAKDSLPLPRCPVLTHKSINEQGDHLEGIKTRTMDLSVVTSIREMNESTSLYLQPHRMMLQEIENEVAEIASCIGGSTYRNTFSRKERFKTIQRQRAREELRSHRLNLTIVHQSHNILCTTVRNIVRPLLESNGLRVSCETEC